MDVDELRELLDSWLLRLRAERKSANTLDSYRRGIEQYLDYCARAGVEPALDRRSVSSYTDSILAAGHEPATARVRQLAVRRFSAWLAGEGEIAQDELTDITPPKLDQKVVDGLTEEECRDLVAACQGHGFRDRRDEAIARLLLECGLRAGEVIAMTTDDVDLVRGLAVVRRGKGGKGRTVTFGPATGAAIDRYRRARRRHTLAGSATFWLGERGQGLGYDGLAKAMKQRAESAGIAEFHLHRTRHAFASRWLQHGGSENALMSMAGWSRRDMIDRYAQHANEQRAHAEARRLNLGDFG
ncbi:Site-specific recombinase XerD [Prauserella aidingensis]|uniref:tyrosine-type recombinase/integrase n=1 Tax=Prauserella aidingensis TaxID=387890 RepID=UPI0020A54196|nr:tyrosine-type recombinase/integrase [Prauserella aidingensis]MCP2255093.1 Site-specific recombinase XerD [Prauserella aidingensis]